jgi:1-deoxy-D-xylulose-5-phosphate synthase
VGIKSFPDMVSTEKMHATYGFLLEQLAHSALQALKN